MPADIVSSRVADGLRGRDAVSEARVMEREGVDVKPDLVASPLGDRVAADDCVSLSLDLERVAETVSDPEVEREALRVPPESVPSALRVRVRGRDDVSGAVSDEVWDKLGERDSLTDHVGLRDALAEAVPVYPEPVMSGLREGVRRGESVALNRDPDTDGDAVTLSEAEELDVADASDDDVRERGSETESERLIVAPERVASGLRLTLGAGERVSVASVRDPERVMEPEGEPVDELLKVAAREGDSVRREGVSTAVRERERRAVSVSVLRELDAVRVVDGEAESERAAVREPDEVRESVSV